MGEVDRRGVLGAAAATVASGWLPAHAEPRALVANTRHGPIRGYPDRGVNIFKGVRYGEDTLSRRFQPPRPPEAWREVADATGYGASAPQPGQSEAPQSEDCLFLNVWTPGLRDGRRRPVMVYIHGGGYANGSGSSPLYDGSRLCRRGDVVVVTVNHRLNAFGYLYLARFGVPGMADSGNAGQLDLVLALRWVQDNIAEFGGDPAKVMVFGQSGGGAKIATLMATPSAAGLFHRAATMSGQQLTASGPLNAERRARAVLDAVGLPAERAGELRSIPVERLLRALETPDPVLPYGLVSFAPVLDDRTLQRHPFYPDAPPQSATVPMIIGNTHDETRAFLGNDPANFSLDWASLPSRLTYANLRVDVAPETVIAEYRRLYPRYSPSEALFSATTAARSWRAAVVEAELRAAAGTPAWVYQLDWASPRSGGRMGAFHGSDIPLVFDNIAQPGSTADGPEAQIMADRMSESFLAFARAGDPSTRAIPPWAPYTLPRRQTMIFDSRTRQEDDPRGGERRFFARIPYVQPGN